MSVPNFSSLAGLEVTEKIGVGWWGGGFQVSTMSNPTKLLWVELSLVELSYVEF